MEYRRLPLEGLSNARDLGGYPVKGGGATSFRRFIRCEAPRDITDGDIDFLREYGVTVSIDFRGDSEIERHPSRLANVQGIEYRRCVTFDKQVAFSSGQASKDARPAEESKPAEEKRPAEASKPADEDKPTEDARPAEASKPADEGKPAEEKRPAMDAFVDWGEKYIEIVENSRGWIRDTLGIMAAADGAVLFNCATGKDRTGVISALLLGIAGVAGTDIVADYCVSELYLKPLYEELLAGFLAKWPDEKADIKSPFFRTDPVNMETLLRYIYETHDGVEGFIKSCGVDDAVTAALRKKLVVQC